MNKKEVTGSEFYYADLIIVPVVASNTGKNQGSGPPTQARQHQLYYNEIDNQFYIKRSDGLFAVFRADTLFDPETNSCLPIQK